MTNEFFPLLMLGVAALFAGFIDAVVGGGGLIQVPTLFSLYPDTVPAKLFGTNKISSLIGTSNSAIRYVRSVRMPWSATLPAAGAAFVFAYLGSMSVAWLPRDLLRPMILVLLIGAAVYTFRRKEFGTSHQPRHHGRHEFFRALLLGAVIGFYDGFFGPAAGSFYALAFVTLCGFNLAKATAHAKLLNATSNIGGLLLFILGGKVIWATGFVMLVGQFLGARMGSRLVLSKGQKLIRPMIVIVSAVMSAKLLYDSHGQEILHWLGMN